MSVQAVPTSRPRYFWWVAVLIVLVGLGLRFWQLGAASLWDDESLTKARAETPLDQFVKSMQVFDASQVPLYYLMLHLFPTDTAFELRLPSAVAGTIGIILLMFVAIRLYGDYNLALVAGGLLALNPYHIWLSRTARPYALYFDIALLVAYFFLLLMRGRRSRGNWAGFEISSMAAYLTHYFAAALPLAEYIVFAFVLRQKRRVFRLWILAQGIAVIPVLLWILTLLGRGTVGTLIWPKPQPVPADLLLTIWNLTVGYRDTASWYALLGLVAVLTGLLPGLYYAFRERDTEQANFFWLWLLAAPLSVVFVVSLFMSSPIYVDRYFIVVLPAVLFLTTSGWMRLPRRVMSLALAVVVVVATSNVVLTFRDGTNERQDWCAAAQYVAQGYGAEDGFLISSQVALLSFFNCLDSRDMLDRAVLFDVPNAGPDGAPARGRWETPVTRLWVVYSNPNETLHNEGVLRNYDPFEVNNSSISDWLIRRQDHVITRKDFRGVTVFLVDVQDDVYNSKAFGS